MQRTRAPEITGPPWHRLSARLRSPLVVATIIGLAIGVGAGWAPKLTAGASFLAVAAIALAKSPQSLLLVAAVVASFVLPIEDLPVPDRFAPYAPGLFVMLALLGRAALERTWARVDSLALIVVAAAFAAWVAAATISGGAHSPAALATALIVAMPALVVLHPTLSVDPTWATRALLALLGALAALAIVEKFVLGANPLLGDVFARQFSGQFQDWGTYRATTVMGHPLVNGTAFAVGLVLCFGQLMTDRLRLSVALPLCVVLAGGLVSTVSRGPALAAAVGCVLVLLAVGLSRVRGTSDLGRRVIAVGFIVLALPLVAAPLIARNQSAQGRDSSATRGNVLGYARAAAAEHPIFGVGPGQAEAYRLARGLPGDPRQDKHGHLTIVQLENSYAQRLVDLGYPGVVLFALLVVGTVGLGLRRAASVPEAAALATLVVAVAGYNALNAHPQLNILVAVLMIMVLAPLRVRAAAPAMRPPAPAGAASASAVRPSESR